MAKKIKCSWCGRLETPSKDDTCRNVTKRPLAGSAGAVAEKNIAKIQKWEFQKQQA